MSQPPPPYGTAYAQALYSYSRSGKALPLVTSASVFIEEGFVLGDDTVFGPGAFSMQFNVTGKKYWHQVVVQRFSPASVQFSLWQFDPAGSYAEPAWFGGAEHVGDLPLTAGSVYGFAVKDDGTDLWGYCSVLDTATEHPYNTGWVKFGYHDALYDVSMMPVIGAGGASRVQVTSGGCLYFVQTNGTDVPDLTSSKVFAESTWPFGQPLPPYEILLSDLPQQAEPPVMPVGTGESSNLAHLITNSNELSPDEPLSGYVAVHNFVVD